MRLSSSALVVLTLSIPGLAYAQVPPPPAPVRAPAPEAAPAEPTPAPAPAPVAAPTAPVAAPTAPVEVAAAPAPAPAASGPAVTWAFEGLVDAYYLYNFTGDPKTQGPKLRQFDGTANSFTLNLVKVGAQMDTDRLALRADIGGGHAAYIINHDGSLGLSGGSTTPEAEAHYNGSFLVEQAFATLKLTPQFTVDFGRFVTTAGAEVIESNKNWLYSRSLLFFGIPLLHTGARLNFQVTPAFKLQASLVNGWNNDPDGNSDKTFGFSAAITPPDTGLSAFLTTYIGKEASTDNRILLDAVVTKDMGPLSLGLNVDYYKEGDPTWIGLAAMVRFLLSDEFNLAARLEYIKSDDGGYGFDGSLYEGTVQAAYTVGKHYELRAEVRVDMSDKEIFAKGAGLGAELKKNQATGLLAALAYF